ncbi:anti-sigma factor [Cryptosporangium aurantiacum]|uniref:Anti-sigma-K factor rskA n=1 Tax=Cryptosporangium aurantiacum TaxID=134849 RepID=A0A1M7QB13_9ACTN|nr:anti-sigma factor [Cryptosporangium aurantiacum]SHN27916.1 Anti-sigma-K factor rskA [Cryptosporangium aurantiacum]
MRHVDPERLTLLALDEETPPADAEEQWARAHLAECPICGREYAALRHVVGLGREADADDLQPPPPPPRVWDAIEAEVRSESPRAAEVVPLSHGGRDAGGHAVVGGRRAGRGRRILTAAAACVLGVVLGVGATLGWQEVRRPDAPASTVVASTALAPVGNEGRGSTGDARLIRTGDRLALEIDVRDLPLTDGFYEAWMFVPGTVRMQAMGAVRPGEVVRFPVPPGLDPAGWRGIDISAETFDGDPAHSATSVLRGELRR